MSRDDNQESVTKSEFIDRVAAASGLGRAEADRAVNAALETIEEVLKRGGEISFTGFGKFSVADRGARQGVNPQTGERIQIAAAKVPRFRAGLGLRKATAGGLREATAGGGLAGDHDDDA